MKSVSRVLCIMGPTSSGKTDLAVALSEHIPLEIVNVDSAQIYCGMDIGAGKVDPFIRQKIPHHLIDFLDPAIPYSAAQFREDAIKHIEEIVARDHLPVLVGGTMLYYKVLQEGLSPVPATDLKIREQFQKLKAEKGIDFLYQQLKNVDDITANRLKPHDSQRIQRALEVFQLTGKPLSFWLAQPRQPSAYSFLNIGLTPLSTPREMLHQRIEARFDAMLAQGLVAEVEKLFQRPELAHSSALRAVGYRQVWEFLEGKHTFSQMRDKAIFATRQLAKRQLTWLRHWPDIVLLDFMDKALMDKVRGLLNEKTHR